MAGNSRSRIRRRTAAQPERAAVTTLHPLAALLCLGALSGVSTAVALPPAAEEVRATGVLDGYIDEFIDEHDVPGLAVAVVSESETVYERLSGHDGNGAAIDATTPFLLGSVAKSFTATLVLQLVEAGEVELDDAVSSYLDGFTPPGGGQAMTVRQLLAHTSGLSTAVGLAHADRFDNSPGAVQAVAEELSAVELNTTPGEEYAYSTANYMVLGALVEEVAGRPFGQVLPSRILDPLGMTDSAVTAEEAEQVNLPPGHRYFLDRPAAFESEFDASGVPYGYVAASLDDLTTYASAHMTGGGQETVRILEPASVAEMQAPATQIGDDRWYGLGWRTGALTGGYDYVEHNGATPGYFAHVVMVPDADLMVVLLANSYSEARAPAMLSAAFDLARIGLGYEPDPGANDPSLIALPYVMFAVAAVGLLALAWVAVRHARAAGHRHGVLRVATLPLVALLLAVGMWLLPAILGYDMRLVRLWMPDAGLAVLMGAVVWLLVATTSVGSDVWLRRRPKVGGQHVERRSS